MTFLKFGPASAQLLSAEEEVELARRIEAGVLARDVLWGGSHGDDACSASRDELEALVHEGEVAQQRFVESNLRLVAMVTGQFVARAGYRAEPLEADLFQEGCVGLLLAVERYDHRRGCRFATYALHWIRALIGAASARARGAADLPASRAEELRALRGLEGELAQRMGRRATVTELAEAAGRSPAWVAGLVRYEAPQSLDEAELVDLPDARIIDPAEAVLADSRPGRELLWHLTTFERQVLELRLGFRDGRPHSYAEVSRRLDVPVARVRRTEARAIESLRAVCPQDAVLHL